MSDGRQSCVESNLLHQFLLKIKANRQKRCCDVEWCVVMVSSATFGRF
jgi:hypothetical protein